MSSNAPILTVESHFQTLREFTNRCRRDKRLTPATQLVYRVLIDLANSSYWAETFVASDETLIEITHLSKQAVTVSKQRLKNLGYLTFRGKPSRYSVYTLVGERTGRPVGAKGTLPPEPPNPQQNPKPENRNVGRRGGR